MQAVAITPMPDIIKRVFMMVYRGLFHTTILYVLLIKNKTQIKMVK